MSRLSAWGLRFSLVMLLLALSACSGGSASSQGDGDRSNAVSVVIPPPSGGVETDLIAGAGQGWPATGTLVGTVAVSDDGNDLTVVYQLLDGYEFCNDASDDDAAGTGEVHLFVGNSPPSTVAPGKYPFDEDDAVMTSTSATFIISLAGNGLTLGGSNLYIIAHAKVHSVTPSSPPTYGSCETAFGFDNATGLPLVSKDEYGWFRHFFGGSWDKKGKWHPNVSRWGWVLGYPSPLPDPNSAWGK